MIEVITKDPRKTVLRTYAHFPNRASLGRDGEDIYPLKGVISPRPGSQPFCATELEKLGGEVVA